jgi:glyoxylase-like metal-dependent hydrolase (beta-lactamase superfamily II)
MRVDKVLAPNPGPFTGPGTNTYVISSAGKAVVLDPGPVIDDHLAGIERALGGLDLLMVMVTHTHSDHAPAANVLGSRWEVDVLGFGPGPEFDPDVLIADGDRIPVGDVVLEALHTPGHTLDHVCYRIADVIFTGDHIMGGSTVVIEDASSYMRSLKRVADLSPESLYPGHGPFMADASAAITDYIEHRLARENEIVAAIERGAGTIGEIVAVVYAEVDPALRMAATQQVGVQLKKLESDGRIELEWPAFGEGPEVRRAQEPSA